MGEAEILIVEDDATIARFVELELEHAGFSVRRSADGPAALEAVSAARPDLVVLDLMLPGLDGLEVARAIRETDPDLPILMLTARAETGDVVDGFEAGADDYLRKPFEMRELLSRVGALLKRTDSTRDRSVLRAAGVEVDPLARKASLDGLSLDLTAREFDLLAYLVGNAGRIVSREEILEEVWGGQRVSDSNVIEVFVCHLRGKIGDTDNSVIQTIRGVGYFFTR
ncbi:MAG: response regulator transcription factor [Coriobacteriia bacterium]